MKTRTLKNIRTAAVRAAVCSGAFLSLMAVSLCQADRYYTVSFTDDEGHKDEVLTTCTSLEELLPQTSLELKDGDVYSICNYGDHILAVGVERTFPVEVTADGKGSEATLTSGTVQEVLKMCGITLGEHDYTEPSLNTMVDDGMDIIVHRVEYRDTVTHEPIPYETQYVYTSLYYKTPWKSVTLQTGADGINEITSRERVVDDKVESSQVISIVQTLAPTNEIIKSYQAGAPVSSLTGPEVVNGVPVSYSAVYTGRATSYYSSRGRGASGLGLHYGTVAVNPAIFPYGTKLYITSTDGKLVYGYAIATDTGGALLNGTALVDLFYETYEESIVSAVKQVNVYVVG